MNKDAELIHFPSGKKIKLLSFISFLENTLKEKILKLDFDDTTNSILFISKHYVVELRMTFEAYFLYLYIKREKLEFVYVVSDSNITRVKRKFARKFKEEIQNA